MVGVEQVDLALWQRMMGTGAGEARYGCVAQSPVVGASWLDAVTFANRLSHAQGFTPAYVFRGRKVLIHVGANGYRLPPLALASRLAQEGLRGVFGSHPTDEWTEVLNGPSMQLRRLFPYSGVVLTLDYNEDGRAEFLAPPAAIRYGVAFRLARRVVPPSAATGR